MADLESALVAPPLNSSSLSRRNMLAGLAALPVAIPAAAAAELDAIQTTEALTLVERCREGNRQWDILGDRITEVEEDPEVEARIGRRPIALVAWRNYSHIGCSEIERARDEFLEAGIAPDVVDEEYRAAKKRERDIELSGEEWDQEAGLTDLLKQYEENRVQTRAAWEALGHVHLTSIRDAVAIIALLRERMDVFDELSDDWEVAAFMNASGFLIA
jgi:hypothetical protein